MLIITDAELASYLEAEVTDALSMRVELANAIVSDLPYVVAPSDSAIPARMRAITLEVAARAVTNPGGYSSETLDDYTYRRPAETRGAGVYLTDAERAELLAIGGATGSSSRSIRLTSSTLDYS